MDNMESRIASVGIDEELEQETVAPKRDEAKVINMRQPWTTWTVAGTEYKLKLTAGGIAKLEQKFNQSLLTAVLEEGIPPVSTVITILQSALQKFHHGMRSDKVEEMFDEYIDGGGTQITLLRDVIYPLMGDAGFFTPAQMKMLTREMNEADTDL